MSRFLKKVIPFISFNLIILGIIGWYLEKDLPYYWGNVGLEIKMDHIQKHKYNTYFIGSSRTAEHIDPRLFDSLTHNAGNSFNLGLPGFQAPESYKFLENFLTKEEHLLTKTIFLELAEMRSIDQNKFHVRGQYFWDLDYYEMTASDHFSRFDITGVTNITLNYLTKITKIGLIKPMIIQDKLTEEQDLLLSDAMQFREGFYIPPNPKTIDTERLNDLRQKANSYYEKTNLNNYSEQHLQKLVELTRLAEEKGIELFFILPPRLKMNMLPLFTQLPNTLDLCNPILYPQLYSEEYSRDEYHLNELGAKEMTSILVNKVIALKN